MATTNNVRQLDDDVVERLKRRAALNDRSFANALAPTEHGEAVVTIEDYARMR